MIWKIILALVAATFLVAPRGASAQDHHATSTENWTSGRPDGHAPIGVMGDHTHGGGEWMLSYRFMSMSMDGNLDGTESMSTQDVFDLGYMISPLKMSMQMHMFGLMHAPSDRLTIMVMAPIVQISMDHVTGMGAEFTTESQGLGDIKIAGLYRISHQNRQALHLNAGVSFPTGAVDVTGDTPAGSDVKLPYPMQIGSGTFDLMPGLTYLGQNDAWSWGAQVGGTFRLGENSEAYTLGNRINITGWGARKLSNWISTSIRLDGQSWGDIDGQDEDLNPGMVPTADPELRAGKRVDALAGVNFYVRSGPVKGHRLAAEVALPVYQSLDTPQLQTDLRIVIGWQYAF